MQWLTRLRDNANAKAEINAEGYLNPQFCSSHRESSGCQMLFRLGVACIVECAWLFLAVAVTGITLMVKSENPFTRDCRANYCVVLKLCTRSR